MSFEKIKNDAIIFFSKAIEQWAKLEFLCNEIIEKQDFNNQMAEEVNEAQNILVWLQDNYPLHKKYSQFAMSCMFNGKEIGNDPIFNVIFGGASIVRIIDYYDDYDVDLTRGCALLRGHLASVNGLREPLIENMQEMPLIRVRKTLSRFNLVENQLKRTRKDKIPYEIQDEYDIQNLLHALLKIDFNDVRKEDVGPICAGASSRIDLVLKEEKILIEVKRTSAKVREKELGNQLIEDIARYKNYPNANVLVCFIYDPEHWVENPEGLIHDLEKQSTENLNVEVIICPKTA